MHSHGSAPLLTLAPSPPLPSASSSLLLSPSCAYLAVTSPQSCSVVKLPRSLSSASPPAQHSVSCRSYGVGPLSPTSSAYTLLHAAFHPLSSHHLLLLLSSSASHSLSLQLFNLTADLDVAELSVPLPSSASASRAVSFCFAGRAGWDAWSVHVLYDDGRISTLCPLLPAGAPVQRAHVSALQQTEQAKLQRAAEAKDARTRLAWLSETFGEADGAAERDGLVVSRPSSLRPLASPAMDVGSSVLHGERAVALISLSATAVQLARVYAAGRVDVLAGVSEVQPRFVEGPLAQAAEATLAAVDTVTLPLPAARQHFLLPLTPASSTLSVLSPTSAHSLSFPYLAELAHVMSQPSLPSSALSSLLPRVHTGLAWSEQSDGVLGGCVLADVALGRQLLLLTTQGVRVFGLDKKLTLASLRTASVANKPDAALAASSSAASFSSVLAPYLSKYRSHSHASLLPVGKQPLSFSSPASFAAFLAVLPQYQSTISDLHTLHGELAARSAVLAAVSDESAASLDALSDGVAAMRDKQQLLRERLALAGEIAAETSRRVERLLGEWRRRSAAESGERGLVSRAEQEWRAEVELREEECRKEQRRADEVAVRVAQLAALRDARRAETHANGSGLQLGSVEMSRLQAELGAQTRAIEEVMADVRELRRAVREKAESEREAGKADAELARDEAEPNGRQLLMPASIFDTRG